MNILRFAGVKMIQNFIMALEKIEPWIVISLSAHLQHTVWQDFLKQAWLQLARKGKNFKMHTQSWRKPTKLMLSLEIYLSKFISSSLESRQLQKVCLNKIHTHSIQNSHFGLFLFVTLNVVNTHKIYISEKKKARKQQKTTTCLENDDFYHFKDYCMERQSYYHHYIYYYTIII